MLNSQQLDTATAYVTERARFVIESFGPRPPGSEAERKTQELVREDLRAVCDGEVTMEEFPVAQKAFFCMQAIGGVLTLAAFSTYWLHPAWALFFTLASLFILYHQLLRYHLLLDPFFPKKPSFNVAGRQLPKGEVKRRIILNGHPDAAYEWRFNYLAPKYFPLITAYTIVGLVVMLLGSAVATVAALFFPASSGGLLTIIGGILAVFVPGGIVGILFNNLNVVAGGANDNLTGTFVATGMLKHLRENGVQLENTELMAVITGSEEAGLRGAKAWAQRHANDFKDVETIVIALDTMRDLDHLTIYSKDLNGTVAHDPAVCRLLELGGKAAGRTIPQGTIPLGSSDGTAFTQAGFRAAALCAMDPHPAHYYHNRRDTWQDMDPACIKATYEVLFETIRIFDEQGLPQV